MVKNRQNGFRSLAAFSLIIALCALVPAAAFAQDSGFKPVVMAQYGFEGTVEGWATRGGNGAVIVSKEAAHSGSSSLKMTGRSVDWHCPRIELTKVMERGAKYHIEAWGRLPAGQKDAPLYLNMLTRFPTKDAEDIISGEVAISASKWTKLEGDYVWDPNAAGSFIYVMYKGSPTADFYIDDVVITKTAASAPVGGAAKLDAFSYDFEKDGTQGWGPRGDGVKVSAIAAAAHSGALGLSAANRGANWQGSAITLTAALKKGAVYGFSAFLRLESKPGSPSTVKFTMEEKQGGKTNWVTVAQAEIKDDAWVQVTGTYSFAAAMDNLSLYAESSSASDTIFSDDIVIKMVTPPPVAAGPAIKIQKDIPGAKDAFRGYWTLGTCVNPQNIQGDVGDLVIKHFNTIVAENAMKPLYVHPSENTYYWDEADKIVAFGKKNLMVMRYHTLEWHEQCPNWFFLDKNGKEMVDETDAAKRAENKKLLLQRLTDHITTIVNRYKDDINSWDVVNEVIDPSQSDGMRQSKWYKIAGKDFVETAFRAARAAGGPRMRLYINDYGTHDPAKRDALFKFVKEMLAKGVPIDGVGHQMHISLNTPINQISDSIKLFGSIGLDNLITELDMGIYSDDLTSYSSVSKEILIRQGYRYKELFDAFKALNKEISMVVFWGINDGNSWLQNRPIKRVDAPLLFDADYQAKYAYWGLIDPSKLPPAPPPPKPLSAPKTAEVSQGTPKIDGVIDASWAKATVLPVDLNAGGNKPATAKGRVMWDENFVYVLMEVTDPVLNDANGAVHEKDSVEAFMDENAERTEFYQGDDAQYRVNFKNEKSFGSQGEDKRFVSAATVTKDGYLVEMAIPFRTIKGEAGKTFDFDLQINDADDSGKRVGISKWSDGTNESWRNTLNFGILKLVK
jgi:endo-1,4-beta-xylanase